MKKLVFVILLILVEMNSAFAQQSGQNSDGVYTIKDNLKKMGLLDTISLSKVHGKYFYPGSESNKLLFYWGRNSKEKIVTTLPRRMFSFVADKKFKKPFMVFNFSDNFANRPANRDEDLSKRDPNQLLMNEGLIAVPVYTVTVYIPPRRFDKEKILWNKK